MLSAYRPNRTDAPIPSAGGKTLACLSTLLTAPSQTYYMPVHTLPPPARPGIDGLHNKAPRTPGSRHNKGPHTRRGPFSIYFITRGDREAQGGPMAVS